MIDLTHWEAGGFLRCRCPAAFWAAGGGGSEVVAAGGAVAGAGLAASADDEIEAGGGEEGGEQRDEPVWHEGVREIVRALGVARVIFSLDEEAEAAHERAGEQVVVPQWVAP